MLKLLKNVIANESGATAIEYAMIVLFIALVIVVAVRSAGTSVTGSFSNVAANMH